MTQEQKQRALFIKSQLKKSGYHNAFRCCEIQAQKDFTIKLLKDNKPSTIKNELKMLESANGFYAYNFVFIAYISDETKQAKKIYTCKNFLTLDIDENGKADTMPSINNIDNLYRVTDAQKVRSNCNELYLVYQLKDVRNFQELREQRRQQRENVLVRYAYDNKYNNIINTITGNRSRSYSYKYTTREEFKMCYDKNGYNIAQMIDNLKRRARKLHDKRAKETYKKYDPDWLVNRVQSTRAEFIACYDVLSDRLKNGTYKSDFYLVHTLEAIICRIDACNRTIEKLKNKEFASMDELREKMKKHVDNNERAKTYYNYFIEAQSESEQALYYNIYSIKYNEHVKKWMHDCDFQQFDESEKDQNELQVLNDYKTREQFIDRIKKVAEYIGNNGISYYYPSLKTDDNIIFTDDRLEGYEFALNKNNIVNVFKK